MDLLPHSLSYSWAEDLKNYGQPPIHGWGEWLKKTEGSELENQRLVYPVNRKPGGRVSGQQDIR